MRLREPFAGYKLTSGHFMFHLAFFIGGQILNISFGENIGPELLEEARETYFLLSVAHILVPLLNLVQFLADYYNFNSLSRTFEVICIF